MLKYNFMNQYPTKFKKIILITFALLCTTFTAMGQSADSIYIAPYRNDCNSAISYTFDDGYTEQFTIACTELEKRGFRGTFGINGSKINADTQHKKDTTRMSWDEVREMSRRGHEVTNHGWAHRNFARFPIEVIREDIRKNDSAIYAVTGIMPRTFLYPNNNKKAEGRAEAEKNRVGTRLFQRSLGSKATRENLHDWVNELIEKRDWGVTMTHGLNYGYDAFTPKKIHLFGEHLDEVKALEDKIWVGTLKEVWAYKREYEDTRISVKWKRPYALIVTPTFSLDAALFDEPLTLVIKREGVKRVKAKQNKKSCKVRIKADKVLIDFIPSNGNITIKMR